MPADFSELQTVDAERNPVARIRRALGNPIILLKGRTDIITNGTEVRTCSEEGSPRRCGGQGDLLAGALATFVAWNKSLFDGTERLVSCCVPFTKR